MSSQSEPQHFDCDAPPYCVVKACEGLGFHSPLDVRWCRMSHVLTSHGAGSGTHGWLFGMSHSPDSKCACGQALPGLERYQFAFASGRKATYFVGQCRRCHRVFWERAY